MRGKRCDKGAVLGEERERNGGGREKNWKTRIEKQHKGRSTSKKKQWSGKNLKKTTKREKGKKINKKKKTPRKKKKKKK